jgi:hypothetical protein
MAVSVITADPIVLPVLTKLVASLTSWFGAQPNPPKRIGVRWGTEYSPGLVQDDGGKVIGDEACDGIVWVRFVSVGDGSTNYPGSGGLARPLPGASLWTVTVEIGVARCAQQWTVGGDGFPTQDTWDALAGSMLTDMAVIRKAVECADLGPGGGSRGLSWGTQVPLPVEGNATGSTIQLTIPVTGSNDCTEC